MGRTMLSSDKLKTLDIHNLKDNRLWVIGDLHGDFESLLNIERRINWKHDHAIFLGDYADRGLYGGEVISKLQRIKNAFPERVHLLKGNHEDYDETGVPHFYPCTLKDEAKRKTGNWNKYFRTVFWPFISNLKIALVIPRHAIFLHGGISNRIQSIKDLVHPSLKVEQDILWSDPGTAKEDKPNPRGVGVRFSESTTLKVCQRLEIRRILRGHESLKVPDGPVLDHQGRVVTVNSTRVYNGHPFAICYPEVTSKVLMDNPRKYTIYLDSQS